MSTPSDSDFHRFTWPHWRLAVFLFGHDGGISVGRRFLRLGVLILGGWIVAATGLWAINGIVFGVANRGGWLDPQWEFSVITHASSGTNSASEAIEQALNRQLAAILAQTPTNVAHKLPQLVVNKIVPARGTGGGNTNFAIECTIAFPTPTTAVSGKSVVPARPVPLLTVYRESARYLTWPTFVVATGISAQSLAKALNLIAQRGPYGDKSVAAPEESIRTYVLAVEQAFGRLDVTTHWKVIWLRRINGVIQFWTLWIFGTLLAGIAARYACLVRSEAVVARRYRLVDFEEGRSEDQLIPEYEAAQKQLRSDSESWGAWLQSPLLEICKQALLGYRVGGRNISQVGSQVTLAAQGFLDRNYSSGAFMRYLLWAIPTAGFVGTVVGIGSSLLITNELQSVDEILRELGRSRVNTNIAVAFDTTFVGLVLSLIGMYIHGALTDEEEAVVQRSSHETTQTLATLPNADPAVQVINLREPAEAATWASPEPNGRVSGWWVVSVLFLLAVVALWFFLGKWGLVDAFLQLFK